MYAISLDGGSHVAHYSSPDKYVKRLTFCDSLSSILYRVADKSGQTNVAFKFSKNLKAQSVRRDGFGSCKMDAGFGMCNSFFKFLFNFLFLGQTYDKMAWQVALTD